jgi:hypothetical protein
MDWKWHVRKTKALNSKAGGKKAANNREILPLGLTCSSALTPSMNPLMRSFVLAYIILDFTVLPEGALKRHRRQYTLLVVLAHNWVIWVARIVHCVLLMV